MQFHRLAIAAAAFALAAVSGAAQAIVINIDATTATPTTQNFAAGTYDIAVIGTAQGGKYNGWTYNSTGTLYRDAFTATFDSSSYTIDHFSGSATGYYQNFASVGAAQAAFAAGPYAVLSNGSFQFATSLLEWTFTEPTTVSFTVPDYKFDDNTGGVSLSVTAAVPEPETYALMLAGLGAMAFIARRRHATV